MLLSCGTAAADWGGNHGSFGKNKIRRDAERAVSRPNGSLAGARAMLATQNSPAARGSYPRSQRCACWASAERLAGDVIRAWIRAVRAGMNRQTGNQILRRARVGDVAARWLATGR